jgi:HEAT repeat protein
LGLCFVLLQNPERCFSLLNLLSKSFNENIRYSVALALGILGSVKYSKEIHSLLVSLWKDKDALVKQAVAISLGLIH